MYNLTIKNKHFVLLTLLRVAIGWHFLYEGLVKLTNPNWSSVAYLLDSKGWFQESFYNMAINPDTVKIVDFLNIWGLILVGAGLLLGLFSRAAAIGGIVMLSFYYFSHPPFPTLSYATPVEGSYLIVNKTMIELIALLVLTVFPTSKIFGLDRLLIKKKA